MADVWIEMIRISWNVSTLAPVVAKAETKRNEPGFLGGWVMANVFLVAASESYAGLSFIYYMFTGVYMSAGADHTHLHFSARLLIKLHCASPEIIANK